MTIITDLKAIEGKLRQQAIDLNIQAESFAQKVAGLRLIADELELMADGIDKENNMRWSGLGMHMFSYRTNHDAYVDTLLALGFTELRFDIPNYDVENDPQITQSKAAVIRAVAKGAKIIWGVGYSYPDSDITATNWTDFRQAILDNALWAQNNGVYEFQLGNEEEEHVDNETITGADIITNMKSVATEVQAIFTNGNVSYSCDRDYIDDWITAGKGDIDILASNIYMGGSTFNDDWKTLIDDLVGAFGVDGTYVTEFGPSWSGVEAYSTDEASQAEAVKTMQDYIIDSGMTRAIYFCYWGDTFGALKADESYRMLWDVLFGRIYGLPGRFYESVQTTDNLTDSIRVQNSPR